MSQQDLHRTIMMQKGEIQHLKQQLAHHQSVNFEGKYKKALKQITGIIKANKQLKEQLVRLNNFKNSEADTINKINKEQMKKAYEKILKQKNQLLGERQSLQLENQKLKYSITALEENVAKLKNEKLALVRQKEGLSKLSNMERAPESTDKQKDRDYKEKQTQLRRTLENLEERHASLSQTNRKLQDHINELETKLFNAQTEYKNKLNEKDIELKTSKSSIREEFQNQISNMKKEVTQLRGQNNQLTIKLNSYTEIQKIDGEKTNEYEEQLIQTLRDLKMQMEPMSVQIAQLQQKNEQQRQQSQREKTNLQLKVMQYEAQIERIRETYKIVQQKLLKQTQKSRKFDEIQKNIKKLEEENRMLGGKIIVLEAKQVALRNREGDELQQRVLQFQTRVQMLLSQKDTITNTKNIGIHQLIALKAYIMELDAKLKQVVNENEYAVKKYKSYKEKCTQLIRELKQHDIAINSLKGKLQGYDKLVVKLQGQLQRAITINDSEMKALNVKITESTMGSIQIYKKRYQSLLEKLNLQQKYAEQEIQTLKLNYDTKMLDLNMKLEQLSSIKQTIGLYKTKNQQLSSKLTIKENELLQTKMSKIIIPEASIQQKNPHKDTINKLQETINTKESSIITLENKVRKVEQQWKTKYNQLEQSLNSSLLKKTRQQEEKKRQIQQLESDIKSYRSRIGELESKLLLVPSKVEDDGFGKVRFTGQISDLQVQLEDMKNRYQIETTKTAKLNKANSQLKQANNELENQISRLKFELKRIEKQFQLAIDDKNTELKRIQSRNQQYTPSASKVNRQDSEVNNFKLASLQMQLDMLQGQIEQVEKDKVRYYNRSVELQKEISQLNMKNQQLTYTLERTKNSINNDLMVKQTEKQQQIEKLQYTIKSFKDKTLDLQHRLEENEQQSGRARNQFTKQRKRLLQQNDLKEEQIQKLSRQLNRIRLEISSKEDMRLSLEQQYDYKLSRQNSQIMNLRDELIRLQNEKQRAENDNRYFRNRQVELNSKLQNQQKYIVKLSTDIKNLQNQQISLESQVMERDAMISKITNETSYIKGEISNILGTLSQKDSQLAKLNNENQILKQNLEEIQYELSNRTNQFNSLILQLQQATNKINSLEHELEGASLQYNRLRSQYASNEQNVQYQFSQLQQKDSLILRLQSENKSKIEQINDLQFELQSKKSKISELQNESIRFRSLSADFQTQIMDKNGQLSKLNYQLNALRVKYDNLEQEHANSDSNWIAMNRELATIKAQIGNYEDDISMKNLTIQRYKSDIRQLTQQIENLNEEIFQKNKAVNTLNQDLFRLKLQGQQKSSQQIYKLQGQIYLLKSKINNLEGQLESKQEELIRARSEISIVRSSIKVQRYSDEEYDLLQSQYYQLQKSLGDLKSFLSQKQLQISQLQSKVQYMKKLQMDAKRRFTEEREDMQIQLQNVLNRERQLRNQISDLENEAIMAQNKNSQEYQWGLKLYQTQCERLQQIVTELQQQVNSLKLKLTYMTNQQERIVQNLTIMTLTFAEVEALRERMKIKQEQISSVRKSLINFAVSNEDITSLSSKKMILDRLNQESEKYQKGSLQQIHISNAKTFNRAEKLFSNQRLIRQEQSNIHYANLQPKISQYNFNNPAGQRESNQLLYMNQYESHSSSAKNLEDLNQNRFVTQQSHDRIQQEDHQTHNQQNWNFDFHKNTDKRLTDLVKSITGQNQITQKNDQLQQKEEKHEEVEEKAIVQSQQESKQVHQQSNNQISSSAQAIATSEKKNIQNQSIKQAQTQPGNINQPHVNYPILVQGYPQQPAIIQQPIQNMWRYGNQQNMQTTYPMPYSPSPIMKSSQQSVQGSMTVSQHRSPQQIRINVGQSPSMPKPISPSPHTSFISNSVPFPPQQQIQYQNTQQIRQYGVLPVAYPGYAR